jgi:hypothetical protein
MAANRSKRAGRPRALLSLSCALLAVLFVHRRNAVVASQPAGTTDAFIGYRDRHLGDHIESNSVYYRG